MLVFGQFSRVAVEIATSARPRPYSAAQNTLLVSVSLLARYVQNNFQSDDVSTDDVCRLEECSPTSIEIAGY